MTNNLRGETYIASSYKNLYVVVESWPVILSGNQVLCYVNLKMSYK